MQEILPYLINGISVGGQYALIAIGYTLVYGILRLINFAHGDVFMVAGLIMVYATTAMPMYLALPLVLIATVLLGFVIERVAYKPLALRAPDVPDDLRHRRELSHSESGVLYHRRCSPACDQSHSLDFGECGAVRPVHQAGDSGDPGADHFCWWWRWCISSTTRRSVWPCGPRPRIFGDGPSSWASRSTR